MTNPPSTSDQEDIHRDSENRYIHQIALISSSFVIIIAGLGLIGLYLDIRLLSSFLSEYKPIAFSAAIVWLFFGIILLIHLQKPWTGRIVVIIQILIGIIAGFSVVNGIQMIRGENLILEPVITAWAQMVFSQQLTPISPVAVFLFIPVAIGSILLIQATNSLNNKKKLFDLTGSLGFLVFFVSSVFLLSYFFLTPFFYQTSIIPIAAPSALAACLTGICLITAAGADALPLTILSGPSVRAILVRRFFPLTMLIIITLSVIQSWFTDFFYSNGTLFTSAFLIGSILITWIIISKFSSRINDRLEQANKNLKRAYEEVATSEAQLRDTVEELLQKDEELQNVLVELQKSETRFRTLFETMKEGVVVHEIIYSQDHKPIDYRIIDANPALETHTGLSPVQAKGRLASDLYHISPAPYLDHYAKVADTGESSYFETYFESLGKYFSISVFSPWKGLFVTVFQDISERKRTELALKEMNEVLNQAQRIAQVGNWTYDLATNQTTWSEEMYRLFGYEPGEVEITPEVIRGMIYPDDLHIHDKIFREALETGIYMPEEYRVIHPDQAIHYLYGHGKVEMDQNFNPVRIVGVYQDITERREKEQQIRKINEELLIKNEELAVSYEELASSEEEIRSQMEEMIQAEERIKQSERRLSLAQQVGKSGSFEMILDSEDIIGSEEFFRIYGMTKVESGLVPFDQFKACTPSYGEILEGFVRLIQEEKPYNHEMVILPADRTGPRYVSLVAQLIRNDEGIPIRVIGVVRDITEEHEIQQDLRETKEFLENLISHANCPIIVWDKSLKITEFNHAFELLTGLNRSDVLNQEISLLFPKESKEKSLELVNGMMTRDRWENAEIPVRHHDGSIRSILWNSAHITDSEGNLLGLVAQGTDITDQKRLTNEKDAAVKQIKRNIAELAILNDRIRNPLTVIMTIVELENPAFAGKILLEIDRINQLITQLDHRWLESDKILNFLRKNYQIDVSLS